MNSDQEGSVTGDELSSNLNVGDMDASESNLPRWARTPLGLK